MYKLGPEPSENAIHAVIAATGCPRTRAKIYLKTNHNDIERAITQLKAHQKSIVDLKKAKPEPATLRTVGPEEASDFPPSAQPSPSLASSASHAVPSKSGNPHQIPHHTSAGDPAEPVTEPTLSLNTPSGSESNLEVEETERQSVGSRHVGPNMAVASKDDGSNDSQNDMQNDGTAVNVKDSLGWDLRLPVLRPPSTLQPGGADGSAGFSLYDVCAAVQHGALPEDVKTYITHFTYTNPQIVRSQINGEIEGFPAMFFVVGANNDANIRIFEQAGGNVNATWGEPAIPLLGFAIMNSKYIEQETTSTVATLLSLGAEDNVIPGAFYKPYDKDIPSEGPKEEVLIEDLSNNQMRWCQPSRIRELLAETLNITQRYHLHRSSKLARPTGRQKDVAARHNSMDLFAVPYFLIGQSAATELLTKSFMHYMLRRQKQPLVVVFAGPSGHGKTELARRLGTLLSLDLHISDCTIVTRETELFGPRKPYVGAEEGSPLNNFLAANSRKKCIVFLDEFEKTTQDIWNALLVPFDNGEYQDRRNLKMVDCKDTIWILATNALDKRIVEFCENNQAIFDEENRPKREDLLEELTCEMKDDFISVFSPPLTGRISAFVPFLPFSSSETCVGAHKYILELTKEVRRPVCTTPGPQEHLLGNIRLKVRSDASICKILTKEYDPALGIRSLRKAVTDRVASLLDSEYLATHDVIAEGLPIEDYSIFVANGRIKVKRMIPPAEPI
ncbi:P-loop containing nucleoside triphosphate hydrolase protein [Lophiotrema nucula]|uniref:P-loop containing nucleoside triphosphate hydrolase protein n=1 Tax=Lophiotrema nucula TaxID=690887 RepID=A0A6A5ZED6_9PLEO|nr:P-loop containing nucleoside triphosphate hydrolase protein [Lophiotrema nucula]